MFCINNCKFVKYQKVILLLLLFLFVLLFSSCGQKSTEGLEYKAVNGEYWVSSYAGKDVNIIIPDFYNKMPVVGISDECFACSDIQTIKLGKNIRFIDDEAFLQASMLKEIVIPSSVEEIGSAAFEECSSLQKVTFEKNSPLERIERNTFLSCEMLETVVLPEKLNFIGRYAFMGCGMLKELELPDSMEEIGESAFSGCKSIDELVLSPSVYSVGSSAFAGFTNNQKIYIEGNTDLWAKREIIYAAYNGEPMVKVHAWNGKCNADIEYLYDDTNQNAYDNEEKILDLIVLGQTRIDELEKYFKFSVAANVTSVYNNVTGERERRYERAKTEYTLNNVSGYLDLYANEEYCIERVIFTTEVTGDIQKNLEIFLNNTYFGLYNKKVVENGRVHWEFSNMVVSFSVGSQIIIQWYLL